MVKKKLHAFKVVLEISGEDKDINSIIMNHKDFVKS